MNCHGSYEYPVNGRVRGRRKRKIRETVEDGEEISVRTREVLFELYFSSSSQSIVRPQFTDEVIKYQHYSLEEIQSTLDSPAAFTGACRSTIYRWRKVYSVLFLLAALRLSIHTKLSFSICIDRLLHYLNRAGDGWLLLLLRTAFSAEGFLLCVKFCTRFSIPMEKMGHQPLREALGPLHEWPKYIFKGG